MRLPLSRLTRKTLALERLEARDCPTAGVLDTTFGGTGIVTTARPNSEGFGAVAIYPTLGNANDGKIVAAGQSITLSQQPYGGDILLARYRPDGSLDPTFGSGGIVITDFKIKNASSEGVNAVAIQPDGKIVVAGGFSHPGPGGFSFVKGGFVARYTASGSLDKTFDKDGKVFLDFLPPNGDEWCSDVLVQPDGKIVTTTTSGHLVRLTSSGGTDADIVFANTGLSDVDLTPSGKYLVAAGGGIWRYNSNLTPDTSFGTNGQFVDPSGNVGFCAQVKALADNSVLALGQVNPSPGGWQFLNDLTVFKLTPSGAFDPSFNGTGYVVQNITSSNYIDRNGQPATSPSDDSPGNIAVQPDGKILVSAKVVTIIGQTAQTDLTKGYSAVLRYTATGSLDATYGSAATGIALNDVVAGGGMAMQGDGRVVVVGENVTPTPRDAALLRYTTDVGSAGLSGRSPFAPAVVTGSLPHESRSDLITASVLLELTQRRKS